ncbi:hypothetical protein A4G20_10285 [Pasteurellaceae bacterium RH1A]|nr:hypothetical protein A4G20_10285 [Pasteurellaceae bacterium RH1A]
MATVRILPKASWSSQHFWRPSARTLFVLFTSLALMGVGDGLLVQAQLGSLPWTVLAQGISLQTNITLGLVSGLISLVVMLLWIPLKLRFGLGTVLNIIVIACFLGFTAHYLPAPQSLTGQLVYLLVGILLFGFGTGFYLTCYMGAGPRDGLMVGMCERFGWRVSYVRTGIEVAVCTAGYFLGGIVGLGTLAFALSIGWVAQLSLNLIQRYAAKP